MARHVLLNNVEHKNLRVVTRHGKDFGEAVGSVPTFPTEFAEILRFVRRRSSGSRQEQHQESLDSISIETYLKREGYSRLFANFSDEQPLKEENPRFHEGFLGGQ